MTQYKIKYSPFPPQKKKKKSLNQTNSMHLQKKRGHVSESKLVIKSLLFKYMKFSNDDVFSSPKYI